MGTRRRRLANDPSQDIKAVAVIEKITITNTDHLSDSWFKSVILGGLKGADVQFVAPLANDSSNYIVAGHLTKLTGHLVFD